ncbi:MAG: hypothetical protein AB7S65_02870 [Sulfuricurvum sp.]
MIKSIFHLFTMTLLSSLVSGCVGYVHVSPTECSADLPIIDYIYEKDNWGPTKLNHTMMINTLALKNEFIHEWGEPDEIIRINDDETILVYNKKKIWCGAVPVYLIPVPLVLPACDGFDRITFKGDTANHVHFKRADMSGIVLLYGGGAQDSKPCPQTKPSDLSIPAFSKEDNIPDNAGLVVLYRSESFVGSAGMHFVMVENDLRVPLYNGSYYKYLSTVGEKEFTYNNWGMDRHLRINVKPKQKYYLRLKITFPTGASLEEVPAEIAEKEILELVPSISQNEE